MAGRNGRIGPAAVASAIVLAVAAAGCAGDDDSNPAEPTAATDGPAASADGPDDPPTSGGDEPDPTTDDTTGDPGVTTTVDGEPGVEPEGFTTVTVRVTAGDGSVCEKCMWLADDADERGRGLMGVTDLGEPVGMIFRFEGPTTGSFFMLDTPTPLSIAWFDTDGALVGEDDMDPCPSDGGTPCPLFSPGTEYVSAIEVVQGGLADVGIGPGSVVEIVDGTEADTCELT